MGLVAMTIEFRASVAQVKQSTPNRDAMRNLFLTLLCLLTAGGAIAEHEADHRYQVRGFVLDANDKAIAGENVVISSGGAPLASGETDRSGFYSLHLHLHNEDLGRRLQLRAGAARGEIEVSFDPRDRSTARVHDANFVAGRLVEGSLGRWRTPPWAYVLAGFIVLGAALVLLEKRRRRKLQAQHLQHAAPGPASGGKRKKKRRKKR